MKLVKYLLLSYRVLIVLFQRIFYYVTFKQFPPPFVSSVVVIKKGDRVLLVERMDGLGLCLPGGFVGFYEKTEDAAKREVKEETGLDVKIKGILTVLSGKRKNTRISSVDIVYTAEIIGGDTTRDSFEGKCKWIHLSEIDQYKFALDYHDVLKCLLDSNLSEKSAQAYSCHHR